MHFPSFPLLPVTNGLWKWCCILPLFFLLIFCQYLPESLFYSSFSFFWVFPAKQKNTKLFRVSVEVPFKNHLLLHISWKCIVVPVSNFYLSARKGKPHYTNRLSQSGYDTINNLPPTDRADPHASFSSFSKIEFLFSIRESRRLLSPASIFVLRCQIRHRGPPIKKDFPL